MKTVDTNIIGKPYASSNQADNQQLIAINAAIRNHKVEKIGATLRASMTAMKQI
jgi:ketol-acid reductoisomerase